MRTCGSLYSGAATFILSALAASMTQAQLKPAAHPFIWMDKGDSQAARQRVDREPWAKDALARTLPGGTFNDLFAWQVMGDKEARDKQKKALLAFAGTDVSKSMPWDDQVEQVLRYDVLFETLSAEERTGIETTFRAHIDWLLHAYYRGPADDPNWKGEKPRQPYTRTNWLPNMHYPRSQGIFLMACALQDEKLIRECYETGVAGFKWFMGEYVADGRLYMEEFSKQYSVTGELLLWCRACRRLGLDELGFGHVGRNGATMRRYIDGIIEIGLPRLERPGGMPRYPHVYMGDAGPSVLVNGCDASGKGGTACWNRATMNGPAPRMMVPLWMEIAHKTWPDGNYDYFLAQMRKPGEDKYYPSLFFDLEPIDPAKVKPPGVKSFVSPERGMAFLKMEESPLYWTSPRPAVAVQFGMYYVHYVHDCFSLLEYQAFGKPILTKRTSGPPMGGGYAGGHPWRDTLRGHNGVVVDGRQVQPVDSGDCGCEHQDIRQSLAPLVKFVAIHAKPGAGSNGLYEGVEAERALFLTDRYMVDLFDLRSDRARTYDWHAHAAGAPAREGGEAWQATNEFDGGKLWDEPAVAASSRSGQYDPKAMKKLDIGKQPWAFKAIQEGGIGTVIRMLGEEGTTLYHDAAGELTTLMVRRRTPATLYAALHEPFAAGGTQVEQFVAIARTPQAIGLRVVGKDKTAVNDRIVFAFQGDSGKPTTLSGDGEEFTFTGQAWIRLTAEEIIVSGSISALAIPAGGQRRLTINGQPAELTTENGRLIYKSK